VGLKRPEEELAEFLSAYPPWLESILWSSYSQQDFLAWIESDLSDLGTWREIEERYESILKRDASRWREYRKVQKKFAQKFSTWLTHTQEPGRPRLDALAEEAAELKRAGKSYAQIAKQLNQEHGAGTTNPEAIRKLLAYRKTRKHPDKT
jgi:hypothetical protein